MTEKEAFERFVDLYLQQSSIAESLKMLSSDVKEEGYDVKTLKKAAKFYADGSYEEYKQLNELLDETYTNLAK